MAYKDVILAETSLVSYWRLGETSGTSAADSKGTNTGTYTGGYTLNQAGAPQGDTNPAVALNGSTGYVTIPSAASLNLGDVVTMEAWVKRGATGGNQSIMSKGNGGGNAYRLSLQSDALHFIASYAVDMVASTITITDTTLWHHCVGTKNGATVKLYIDGVDRTGTVTNFTMTNTTTPLLIGLEQGPADYMNGTIDEAAVYSTALSAAAVKTHYDEGTRGAYPNRLAESGAVGRAANW